MKMAKVGNRGTIQAVEAEDDDMTLRICLADKTVASAP